MQKVTTAIGDMCQFDGTVMDRVCDGPKKRRTKFMTNSDEIAAELSKRRSEERSKRGSESSRVRAARVPGQSHLQH